MSMPKLPQNETIKLEHTWQPLYDSVRVPPNAEVKFFLSTGAKDWSSANLRTPGMLSWPKRYWAIGVELVLSSAISEMATARAYLQFVLGEKYYFVSPLMLMQKREKGKRFFSPFYETAGSDMPAYPPAMDMPVRLLQEINRQNIPGVVLHIPCVRQFYVRLITDRNWGVTQEAKLQLMGAIGREIQ